MKQFQTENAPAPLSFEEAAAAIRPGRYRHFKGRDYEVLFLARHSETEEALYGERGLWVRPASMWLETLEREGRRFRRFTPIPEEQEMPEINEKEIRI